MSQSPKVASGLVFLSAILELSYFVPSFLSSPSPLSPSPLTIANMKPGSFTEHTICLTLWATQTRGDKSAITGLRGIAIRAANGSGSLNKVLEATHHPLLHLSGCFWESAGAGGLSRHSARHHHPGGHLTPARNAAKHGMWAEKMLLKRKEVGWQQKNEEGDAKFGRVWEVQCKPKCTFFNSHCWGNSTACSTQQDPGKREWLGSS